MCLQCVAEGSAYVGTAVGALQVMKLRARSRRLGATAAGEPADAEPVPTDAGADIEA